MAGIFETIGTGATRESPITVKPGAAAADTFTPFITGLAVEAGMEGVAQHALSEQREGLEAAQEQRNEQLGEIRLKSLNEKFDALNIGVSQGLPTAQANARARALLAETKASVPWIGDRADQAFKTFFGGSAGGRGFEMSTQEKAIQEFQEDVASVSATMGVSLRTAQTVVQTKAMNEHDTQLLLRRSQEHDFNEGDFRNFISARQQTGSVNVQAIMEAEMRGASVLSPQGIQSVSAAISTMANQMKLELQQQAFDKEGKPLLSQEALKQQDEAIDKWAQDQKVLIKDRSYQELAQSISETKTAELAIAAADALPFFSVLNKAGGAPLVESAVKAIQNPKYVPTLIAAMPQLAAFFDKEGQPKQILLGSLAAAGGQAKITDPDSSIKWAQDAMKKGGAEISQRFLEDPKNIGSSYPIYQQVDNEDPAKSATAKQYHKDAGRISPSETGRTLSSPTFRQVYNKSPNTGFKVVASSVEGMANNFKSAYLTATGTIPDYVEISAPEQGFLTATTSDGDPIPNEAKVTLSHAYNALKNNPKYVAEYEKLLGIPLTPTDILELSINNKVHQKFLDRMTDQEGEFKGAEARDLDKRQQEFENMGAWSRALNLFTIDRTDPKKAFPWVYSPKGFGMIEPTEREFDIRKETTVEPQSKLTPEDAEYIKAAPNLEEKARRAKLMGVPAEDVDKITEVALNIERNK